MRNRIVYVEAILRNQLLTSTSLMLLTGTGAIGCWKLPPIDLQNDSGAIGSAHQMINADSRADAKSTGAMSLDGQASPITEQTVTAIADASIGARATESAEAGADVVVAQVDAGANAGSIASTDASSNQKTLPAPTVLSTPMVPPINSTSRFETTSPMPVPSVPPPSCPSRLKAWK